MYCPDTSYNQFSGTFTGARIYYCHTSRTSLSSTFSENYSGNTPTMVYSNASATLNWTELQWSQITFDNTFSYNGTNHLLIEIQWDGSPSGGLITSTTAGTTDKALLGSSVGATTGGGIDRPVFQLHYIPPSLLIRLTGDLAFGNTQVGSIDNRTLTIHNDGNSAMTVSSISYPSGFSGNWSGSISESDSQNVTVAFSPTAEISYSGNLTVNSDKTSGTNTCSVSGTGTPVPAWWYTQNVINTNLTANDYAAVNQGQLKWITKQAYSELADNLNLGTAGTNAATFVLGLNSNDVNQAANIGQLKNAAKYIYDWLKQEGITNSYPWTETTTDDNDYAPANIGQVKNMFNFNLP